MSERTPFSFGTIILAGGATLLGLVLIVGFLLPASWSVVSTRTIEASPAEIFAYLDSPEGWRAWTPWPDSGLARSGPERGEGARLAWDDQELGRGSFTIVQTHPPGHVAYEVEVNGGSMLTSGSILLTPSGTGTRVEWHEDGNLGRNPLMGYWARFMEPAQSAELEKSLGRLEEVVLGASAQGHEEAPADTSSTGAGA